MTDRPIIFSAPMVRAWLEGRKSMTRRLLYGKRKAKGELIPASATMLEGHPPLADIVADEYWTLTGWQRVKSGDRLWVRENVRRDSIGPWYYAADGVTIETPNPILGTKMVAWAHHEERESVPSIHMPRFLSRITLIVSAVKIERLQDISEEDAKAEGVERAIAGQGDQGLITTHRTGFVYLWGSLYGTESWLNNPEVICITAKAVNANIDTPEAQAA